jgi:pimeloyl-ACP methyl ester carboxylesterase
VDRFARSLGNALLILFVWPISATANSEQPASPCAKPPKVPRAQLRTVVQEDNLIVIDSDGVSPETSKYQAQLEHMFQTIEHQPRHRLLLFVHGGLTTIKTANQLAADVNRRIDKSSPETYPIFLNWDSGLLSSYGHHLAYERNGISYKGTPAAFSAAALFPFVLFSDLGRGLANLPMNVAINFGKIFQNADGIYQQNTHIFPVRDKFFEVLRRFASDPRASQRDDQFFHNGLEYVPGKPNRPALGLSLGPDSSDTVRAGLVAENVLTAPLQFTTEPALDTVGTAAWKNMLRRTRTMFYPAGNFITTSKRGDEVGTLYPGAAALFFEALDRFLKQHPSYYLDVVAHSMGALVMDEALREYPDLRIRNLVYMGAACSIRDFQASGGIYLRFHSTDFYNLCLHPRAELDESNVGGIPVRGSLLTWIDEFFQSPESFGDRTLGTFENAVIAYQLLPASARIHLKAFGLEPHHGPPGYSSGPRKHGEFPEFEFWNPDFWRTADAPRFYRRFTDSNQ